MYALSEIDKDWVRYQIDRFLKEIDARLDRLESLLRPNPLASATPEPPQHSIQELWIESSICTRTYTVLLRYDIVYLEQLINFSANDLSRWKGCGRVVLLEIERELAKHGLSLKKD